MWPVHCNWCNHTIKFLYIVEPTEETQKMYSIWRAIIGGYQGADGYHYLHIKTDKFSMTSNTANHTIRTSIDFFTNFIYSSSSVGLDHTALIQMYINESLPTVTLLVTTVPSLDHFLWAYPCFHWPRGGVHSGQVASLSQTIPSNCIVLAVCVIRRRQAPPISSFHCHLKRSAVEDTWKQNYRYFWAWGIYCIAQDDEINLFHLWMRWRFCLRVLSSNKTQELWHWVRHQNPVF